MVVNKHYIPIKPYSLSELAAFYDVDRRTLKRWLKPYEKEIEEKTGRKYSKMQVEMIFHYIGLPDSITLST